MKFRQLLRFRLRTLLILFAVLSVCLTLHIRSTRMQKEALQAIRDYGGWIRYDFQFPSGHFSYKDFDSKAKSWVPKWLLDQLGFDFFHDVVQVNLSYSDDSGKREENDNPSDEALQHLPKLPNLRILLLGNAQASDASMRHLAKLKRLEHLYMWDVSQVSDAGVNYLRNLANLKTILLDNSQITDESLRIFGHLKELEYLALQGHKFTDTGLSYLVDLTKLKTLCVGKGDYRITDKGILHLCQLKKLETLELSRTLITMQGLEQLAVLRNLKWLLVTEEEFGDTTQLAKILNGCRIN